MKTISHNLRSLLAFLIILACFLSPRARASSATITFPFSNGQGILQTNCRAIFTPQQPFVGTVSNGLTAAPLYAITDTNGVATFTNVTTTSGYIWKLVLQTPANSVTNLIGIPAGVTSTNNGWQWSGLTVGPYFAYFNAGTFSLGAGTNVVLTTSNFTTYINVGSVSDANAAHLASNNVFTASNHFGANISITGSGSGTPALVITNDGSAGSDIFDFYSTGHGLMTLDRNFNLTVPGTLASPTGIQVTGGGSFVGSGSGLTSLPAASLTGQVAIANGGSGTYTNVIWVSPVGSDSNDGLSIARPKLTFDGVNAISKPYQTFLFLAGLYPVVSNALIASNNTIIAYGAIHTTGTNASDIVDFYGGTNAIYGGTWIYTNNSGLAISYGNVTVPYQYAPFYFPIYAWQASPPGQPLSISMMDTVCYGYYDILLVYEPTINAPVLTVDMRNNRFESFTYDNVNLYGTGTNSVVTATGNTFISHGNSVTNVGQGVPSIARAFSVNNMTANLIGNNFIALNGTNDTVGIESQNCILNLSGNQIQAYTTNYTPNPVAVGVNAMLIWGGIDYAIGQNESTNTWNIDGHPYPNNRVGFGTTDTVNYLGWGTTNGQQSSTNFVGTLTVTNAVASMTITTLTSTTHTNSGTEYLVAANVGTLAVTNAVTTLTATTLNSTTANVGTLTITNPIVSATVTNLTVNHIIGNSSGSITGTTNAGAGSATATVSFDANATDTAMTCTIATGTSPTASTNVVTITFGKAWASAPHVLGFVPLNASAENLPKQLYVNSTNITTTNFQLWAGSSGLSTGTTYIYAISFAQ